MRWTLLAALVLASGCLSTPTLPPTPLDLPPPQLPESCDAQRPAQASNEKADAKQAPYPCFLHIGGNSFEPNIGIAPDGTIFYYPILQGAVLGAPEGLALARSRDQGQTWQILTPRVGPVPVHAYTADPYMYVDPTTGRVFIEDLMLPPFTCGTLSYSDDAGDTWTHTLAGCMEFDHVTLFAGRPVTSTPIGYPNIVYRCAINTVILVTASFTSTCQRSIDGGRTWLPPGTPAFITDPRHEGNYGVPGYCDGALGHGTTDHRGWVYLPKGWCGKPWLAISKDEGFTWQRVQVSQLGMNYNVGGTIGHEAGVGVDEDGNIHYVWPSEDRLLYFATSRDGGATWSTPTRISPANVTQASIPQLTVGDAGHVAIAYVGSTNAPAAPFSRCRVLQDPTCVNRPENQGPDVTWNAYMATTHNALDAEPTWFTASINPWDDPIVRGRCSAIGCGAVADFLDVRIAPDGTPWASFVDGCTGPCVKGEGASSGDQAFAGRLWVQTPMRNASSVR